MLKKKELIEILKSIRTISPWAYFDCMILVTSIYIPLLLLSLSLHHTYMLITTLFGVLNTDKQIHEIMLILMPIAIMLFMTGILCTYRVGIYDRTVSPYMMVFGLFSAMAYLFIEICYMFYFLYDKRDVILTGDDYKSAYETVITSIACFIIITLFTSLSRNWPSEVSKTD